MKEFSFPGLPPNATSTTLEMLCKETLLESPQHVLEVTSRGEEREREREGGGGGRNERGRERERERERNERGR